MTEDHRRLMLDGRAALERTSASLARSSQIAIETEHIGTEVLNELGEQRESLLRSQRGLQNTDDSLSKSRVILRSMQRKVFYNKVVLLMIIAFEILILCGAIYLKFIK